MSFQPLEDKNPTSTLKRFKREVAPMQFVREIIVNSTEANATTVRAYFDPQYKAQGIKKLCFADDGKGMTAAEMAEYLGKYNSSSKTTKGDYHDNFGIGVKATTLLTNPYGVVFLSWTEESPCGNMIWFTYDEQRDRVGLKPVEVIVQDEDEDEEYESVLCTTLKNGMKVNVINLGDLELAYPDGYEGIKWWLCKKTAKIDRCGTIIMLLGDSHDSDSTSASWSMRTLPHYISSRFLRLGIDLISSGDIGDSKAIGLRDVLLKHQTHYPDLVECVDGYSVEVLYVNVQTYRDKSNRETLHQMSDKVYHGFCSIAYKDELYNTVIGKREARSWGISHDDVIPHIFLIVHAPHRGLQADGVVRGAYPNERRDRLLWDDESSTLENREIDLSKVKHYFSQNQPARLRKMLDDAYASTTDDQSADTRDLMKKYRDLFKSKPEDLGEVIKSHKDGDQSLGDRTPQSEGGNAGPAIHPDWMPPTLPGFENSKPEEPTKEKAARKGIVKIGKVNRQVLIEWRSSQSNSSHYYEGFEIDGLTFPYEYKGDRTRMIITANLDHTYFKDCEAYLMNRYDSPSEVEMRHQITTKIRHYYGIDIKLYIEHLHAQSRRNPMFKGTLFDQYITPQVLAARLLGSAWLVMPKIEQSLSAIGYKKKS